MGAVITFHSYRGGTGKTLLAVALTEMFTMKGKSVCLLDLDFYAPNISFAFEVEKAHFWLNDFLDGKCEIEKVLIDLTDKYGNGGQLFIGPADFRTVAIREMSTKSRKWEMKALGRLLSLKSTLLNDLKLDYLIFDTSSGMAYSSINAVVTSDMVLLTNTTDKLQVKGTRVMIRELYDLFETKTGIILNKVPVGSRPLTEVETLVTLEYEKLYDLPVLGIIPCFCEVLEAGVSPSFLKDNPNHLFTKILEEIASRVDSMSYGPFVEKKDSELIRIYREQFIKKVTGVHI